MSHRNCLGIIAITAVAVIAFVGAGTASASTLCTAGESLCSAANTIKEIEMSLTGGTARIESTGGTVLGTCTAGGLKAAQERDGVSNAGGKITSLTWGGCTNTTDTISLGELEISANGSVTAKGSDWTTSGIFNSSCTYGFGTGTTLGTLVSGSPATLSINAIVKKTAGGSLCPGETRWTASYQVTNHTGAWVTAS